MIYNNPKLKSLGFLTILAAFAGLHVAQAQEHKEGGHDKEPFHIVHSLGINIGHANAFSGVDPVGGGRKTLVLPYWGIDYTVHLSPKFALGLHTDLIVETFEVEKDINGSSAEVIERTKPIAPALMGLYSPNERWSFGLGMGAEFAKEDNLLLNRLGVEYAAPIRGGWEVFGILQYDIRWDAYDTWTIGLGIAKHLGKHHPHEHKE